MRMHSRWLNAILTICLGACAQPLPAQEAKATAAADKPLPDVATLMRDVQAHQKELDKIKRNYIYREASQEEELDGDNHVKKTTTEEREIFYIGRHEISRKLRKDGHDLSTDEQRKEQERVDKEIEKYKKDDAKKAEKEPGDDDIGVDTFLRLARVTDPRREMRNGRAVIVFDFIGNPDAKSHGLGEGAVKKLSGTIWIDEAGREVSRVEARFADGLKIGAGLLASLQKGATFTFEQALVNDEVWLPTFAEANFAARLLLFKSIRAHQVARFSDYRKFRTKSVISLAEEEKPQPAAPPPPR